jgi:hypothetical protein
MIEDLNKAVFTTKKVLDGAPIEHIYYDADGDWQFFCSEEELTEDNARVISLDEIIKIDPTLKKVIETLPKGFEAHKKANETEWFIGFDEDIKDNLN